MAVPLQLETLRERLARQTAKHWEAPEGARIAAVAAVLRPVAGEVEVLLIRRAQRAGDPWSGHMAFPGGHADPGDRDTLATALRETQEEVGLVLSADNLLGRLDDPPAVARGRFTGLVVIPYVFAVEGDPPLLPNAEVADTLWAPLGPMARGEADTTKVLGEGESRRRLPGYRVQDQVVWGLTHRMLGSLLSVIR